MRLLPTLLAASVCLVAVPAAAQDGFDDRGVDRHDRTPDWKYRRGEAAGKGAYYDAGRYGPRGLTREAAASRQKAREAARLADARSARRTQKERDER